MHLALVIVWENTKPSLAAHDFDCIATLPNGPFFNKRQMLFQVFQIAACRRNQACRAPGVLNQRGYGHGLFRCP